MLDETIAKARSTVDTYEGDTEGKGRVAGEIARSGGVEAAADLAERVVGVSAAPVIGRRTA